MMPVLEYLLICFLLHLFSPAVLPLLTMKELLQFILKFEIMETVHNGMDAGIVTIIMVAENLMQIYRISSGAIFGRCH